MTSCIECTGCAIHVLLDKVEDELDGFGINAFTCEIFNLLGAASALVDDLVAHAKMLEDRSSSEKDEVEESTAEDS